MALPLADIRLAVRCRCTNRQWSASISANPDLRASEKRNADVTAHLELASAVEQPGAASVGAPLIGVKDGSAIVFAAEAAQAAKDRHADDRPVLEFTLALIADRIRRRRGKHLDDGTDEFAISFLDQDQPLRLAGAVAERRPQAGRGRRLRPRRAGPGQCNGAEQGSVYGRAFLPSGDDARASGAICSSSSSNPLRNRCEATW